MIERGFGAHLFRQGFNSLREDMVGIVRPGSYARRRLL